MSDDIHYITIRAFGTPSIACGGKVEALYSNQVPMVALLRDGTQVKCSETQEHVTCALCIASFAIPKVA